MDRPFLGLKRLREMPVAAIVTTDDGEGDPDAPVTETAKAA